ncbi:MAG: protein kinase [Thermoanaerobaculia bacterium]
MSDSQSDPVGVSPLSGACPKCGSTIAPDANLCTTCGFDLRRTVMQPGTVIDEKYEIISVLGVGGMGEVYKARHTHLHSLRCIKVMKRDLVADEGFRARFLREARLATRLHHPNLAIVHDFSTLPDGGYYMVSELVDGITLRRWTQLNGRFPVALACDLILQVLDALDYCHRRGLLHRDISADNIMVEVDEDGRQVARIIDLGIAKLVTAPASETTQVGVFVGNPKYSSPEQLGMIPEGESIDHRSDLYSLGVVFYEMIAGVQPYGNTTPQGYIVQHLTKPPVPISRAAADLDLPMGLEAVILKALEKDRRVRWQNAREFAEALRRVMGAARTLVLEKAPEITEEVNLPVAPELRKTVETPLPPDPEESAWIRARRSREVGAYRDYLRRFPDGRWATDARKTLEEMLLERIGELEQERRLGELEGIAVEWAGDDTIGRAARRARTLLWETIAGEERHERSEWERAWREGTVVAFGGFIEAHPDSGRKDEAERALAEAADFESALEKPTVERWKEFRTKWPEGRHRIEAEIEYVRSREAAHPRRSPEEKEKIRAEAEIVARSIVEDSLKTKAPKKSPAERRRPLDEATEWQKAWESGTADAWSAFLEAFPGSAKREGAAAARNEAEAFHRAVDARSAAIWRAFLATFPDGRHHLEAMLHLENLKGN